MKLSNLQKKSVFNIACSKRTSLNEMLNLIKIQLSGHGVPITSLNVSYKDFRNGDVKHSLANIDLAREVLGYEPSYDVDEGLSKSLPWYLGSK